MEKKNQREGNNTSKPNISFREDPSVIEWLKEELGVSETASAVRAAIQHTLVCNQKMHQLQQLQQMTHDMIGVKQAAHLLKKHRSTIVRMIHRKQIIAYKIGGVYSIPVSAVEKLLIPTVSQE